MLLFPLEYADEEIVDQGEKIPPDPKACLFAYKFRDVFRGASGNGALAHNCTELGSSAVHFILEFLPVIRSRSFFNPIFIFSTAFIKRDQNMGHPRRRPCACRSQERTTGSGFSRFRGSPFLHGACGQCGIGNVEIIRRSFVQA